MTARLPAITDLTAKEWRGLLGRAAMVGFALSRTGPDVKGHFLYFATHAGICREIGDANNIRALVDIVDGSTP